jgi:hypothetical protein
MKAEFFSPKTFFVLTWRRYGAMTPISSIVTFVLSNPEIRSATFIVSTAHHTAIILGLFFKPSKNNHDATNSHYGHVRVSESTETSEIMDSNKLPGLK